MPTVGPARPRLAFALTRPAAVGVSLPAAGPAMVAPPDHTPPARLVMAARPELRPLQRAPEAPIPTGIPELAASPRSHAAALPMAVSVSIAAGGGGHDKKERQRQHGGGQFHETSGDPLSMGRPGDAVKATLVTHG